MPKKASKSKKELKKSKSASGKKDSDKKKKSQCNYTHGIALKTFKKFYPSFKAMSSASASKQQSILSELPNSGVSAVCECLYNVLYSNQVDKQKLKRLKKLPIKTKDIIRELTILPRKGQFAKKRALLRQSGGSIGAIIAAALPLLLNLFAKKS